MDDLKISHQFLANQGKKFFQKSKQALWDILFPRFCLNCGKEGSYLCPDCFSLVPIADRQYCPFCFPSKIVLDGRTCSSCRRTKNLTGLYSAVSYDNPIVKKLITQFKYSYVKELAQPLSSFIIAHLINLNKLEAFSDFVLVPIPLHRSKLKKRGFNQSEEIAKELAAFLKIPLLKQVLIKTKPGPSQVELKKEQRQENIKNTFFCLYPKQITGKKILLVDDVFTTGATMEEGARVLKKAGARQVWGIVVARGQ